MIAESHGVQLQEILQDTTPEGWIEALGKLGIKAKELNGLQGIESLSRRMNGQPAIVSVLGSKVRHAVVVDKVENGLVYIRDPLPVNTGSSYTVSVEDFDKRVFEYTDYGNNYDLTAVVIEP